MNRRIALLQEHTHHPVPGEYDYRAALMGQLLAHAGINMADCFLGYGDDPALPAKLAAYQPHFIVLWEQHGSLLRLFGTQKRKLDDWAGYVWLTEACVPGVKCLATYAPGRIRVEMGLTGTVRFHLARVAREAATDGLVVPDRYIRILSPAEGHGAGTVVAHINSIRQAKRAIALDIEGACGMGPACIGFATNRDIAIVVPFYDVDGVSVWNEAEELIIVEAVVGLLEDPEVPKIIQNALFELFVIAWTWGCVVRGLQDDTMLKHFEIYCELEKALEFQATLYTNQPYWKLEHRQVEGRYVPFRNGRRATTEEWMIYNGTDCCVTYECNEVMEARLKPQQREHYRFNMDLLVPLCYMSLRGIRYDHTLARERLAETQTRIYELQDQINQEAARSPERAALRQFYEALAPQGQQDGVGVDSQNPGVARLVPLLTAAFCQARRTEQREVEETTWQPMRYNGKRWVKAGKRIEDEGSYAPEGVAVIFHGNEEPAITGAPSEATHWLKPHVKRVTRNVPVDLKTLGDVLRFAKDSERDSCERAICILRQANLSGGTVSSGSSLSAAQRGELATLLGLEVKINSTNAGGDAQWYLYTHCGLPKQYQKEGNKLTTRLASDDEAIIKAWIHSGKTKETRDERALVFLRMRRMVTQTKFLVAEPDEDGRIRSSMNLVATPTCRMAMYGSPTGTSDLNLQTIGKKLRDLFVADEGCYIGQRDLSNSDAYSVAAFCAMLGDSTMLDDLRAKVKPANVLARIYEAGPAVNQLTREQLREECKKVDGEGWLYFACKRVLHGCYTAGHELLTPNGWVKIEQLGLGEKIACYDLLTRHIHFERPSAMTTFDYSGNLYTFEGHSISLTVTADHRMPYVTNDNPKWIAAAEMHVRKAGNLPTAGIGFRNCGPYSRVFGQLIAAIHSDGCYHTARGYLTFNFKKARKIERVQLLLKLNDLPFNVRSYKDGSTKINVYDKDKLAPFKVWGKRATAQMLNWGEHAIAGYLAEYSFWDGHRRGPKQTLFSVDREHLDWIDTFAHLALQNGCAKNPRKSGFGSIVHVLSLNNRTFAERGCLKSSVVEVKDVPVYCPTVSTGYVLVRRQGKICVSGNSNYGMGKVTMANQILTDSFKLLGEPIWLEPSACARIQERAFFVRYPGVRRWHDWMAREIREKGVLTTSTGFQRRLFGRKDSHDTLKECLAHYPQYYTTRAIKMSLWRQWRDPANRREEGSLRVEPLLLVHDSNVSQWREEDTDFAKLKLAEWFDTPMQIAGLTLTIPASGTYGRSWGAQTELLG